LEPFFLLLLTTETLIEYDKSYIECVVFSRHEVPVTSQPITIVFMDDDIVVVNKPASIPVSGF
jgi:23S rRNA-/tRNA-specific pseudouridylate synthase